MIENWFTKKCLALVNAGGSALSGEALAAAENALQQAKAANCKLWSDRDGFFYRKERKLFARTEQLRDANGSPVRICGHLVKVKAKFCSHCGSPAPGGWHRCGGCGRSVGNESHTCPHCGRPQHTEVRQDLIAGFWRKQEEIFAERFELADAAELMPQGLNVQESQSAILLDGGAVSGVLGAGFYAAADLAGNAGIERSLVMVESAEIALPVCVEKIRTQEGLESDLHTVLALSFQPELAQNFMKNLMGESLYLREDTITSALGYDEIAHCILQNVDGAVRDFCGECSVDALFKDADLRIRLENFIAERIRSSINAIGLQFIRLKEAEFESEVFERLRQMAGEVETKRRESEFLLRADELAGDTARRKAMNEHEMEDYLKQLAQEKTIKDEVRQQELERMRRLWQQKQETESRSFEHEKQTDQLLHEHDLDDIQQARQLARDRKDFEFEEEEKNFRHREELKRMIEQQKSTLEFTNVERQVQEIRIDIQKKQDLAEKERLAGLQQLDFERQSFKMKQKIELMQAVKGADLSALLMAEDDPEKREHLLRLHEQELQSKMTPELLLAAAAARGNAAAAAAIGRMSDEMRAALERSKTENKEVYERMLQMNERMFAQATEALSKNHQNNTPTTQIIK